MTHELQPVPSRAAVKGHPIHHMLVPFPIAFLMAVLFADVALLLTADPFWARAGQWLLGAGLLGGLAAAAFGAIDFLASERARSLAAGWMHLFGNATALLLAGWNFATRFGDAAGAVAPGGIILSLATAFILVVTGWLGGELAYRHRIGMIPEGEHECAARAEPGVDLAF